MSLGLVIVIVIICVLLEGFFSGSEMAFVNADKYRLTLAQDAGSRRAALAMRLIKSPAKFFSTTLFGTNVFMVTGSVIITLFIIDRWGGEYAPFALLFWPFALIFGEIVPKSIYQHHADKMVVMVAPILMGASVVFYPAVWLLSKLTDSLFGGLKRRAIAPERLSREELELMLEVGRAEASDVRPVERTLISRIFDLADKKVENIMTPLVDVVAVPLSSGGRDAEHIFESSGHSRLPVYDGRVLNIVGYITNADMLFGKEGAPVRELTRPAYYVPEEMPLDELLVAMKRRGQSLAVAVDEYGAATGIVTVEDLMEEVVGEIRDEHDKVPSLYTRLGHNHYLVRGRLEIEHANERLKLDIPEGEYETIAGFVIHQMERIPKVGESFVFGRFEYTVRRATDRAVIEVEVVRRPEKA